MKKLTNLLKLMKKNPMLTFEIAISSIMGITTTVTILSIYFRHFTVTATSTFLMTFICLCCGALVGLFMFMLLKHAEEDAKRRQY